MPGFVNTPLLDITTAGTNQTARQEVQDSGLEFTPLEEVAQTAWLAVHEGKDVHYPVGKTAKRLRFLARWVPGLIRRTMKKEGRAKI
jgi:hypothetical protein